jgi:hypothetical protein
MHGIGDIDSTEWVEKSTGIVQLLPTNVKFTVEWALWKEETVVYCKSAK